MERDSYSVASIRRHLRAADRFGNWLLKQGITVPEVNPATVERYIEGLERVYSAANPQGRLPHSALGLRGLIDLLRQHVAGLIIVEGSITNAQRWLTAFDRHLDRVAGCGSKTRSNYLRYARRLLHELFAGGEVNWAKLNATVVTSFVRREASSGLSAQSGDIHRPILEP